MAHENETKNQKIQIEGVPLKRRLGFVSGVALITGTIIGSGIFVSPKGVLKNTGSVGLCLLVWCFCGALSMCASLVYAELGLLIPKSGREFGYFLAAFGTFPAFMYTWTEMLRSPCTQILKALTVAEYISKAVFDECESIGMIKNSIAAIAILTAGIGNCVSVRLVARTQILFTLLKLAGLIVIVIGGCIMLAKGQFGSLTTGFDGTIENPTRIASAVFSGLFAFNGWAELNNVIEEVKNPRRNLPLCIITSVLLVLVVYIMVNISYFTVLNKDEYLSSWAVAATWAEYVLPSAVILVPITVACSVYGALNSGIMGYGRIVFAASREGLFPEVLSYLNVNSNIPLPPTILVIVVSLVLLVPSDIESLLNMLGFLTWFFYGLGMIAHIILRYKMKDVDRKLRVPLIIPIVVLLCCIYLVVSPFLEQVKPEFWYAVIYLAIGAAFYLLFVFFKLSLPGIDKFSKTLQLLLDVAPPQEFRM